MTTSLGEIWHYPLPGSVDQNLYPIRHIQNGENWGIYCRRRGKTLLPPLYEAISPVRKADALEQLGIEPGNVNHLFVVLSHTGEFQLFDVDKENFLDVPNLDDKIGLLLLTRG